MCDTTCRSSRNDLNVAHSLKVQFASSFNQFDIKVPISNESSSPEWCDPRGNQSSKCMLITMQRRHYMHYVQGFLFPWRFSRNAFAKVMLSKLSQFLHDLHVASYFLLSEIAIFESVDRYFIRNTRWGSRLCPGVAFKPDCRENQKRVKTWKLCMAWH